MKSSYKKLKKIQLHDSIQWSFRYILPLFILFLIYHIYSLQNTSSNLPVFMRSSAHKNIPLIPLVICVLLWVFRFLSNWRVYAKLNSLLVTNEFKAIEVDFKDVIDVRVHDDWFCLVKISFKHENEIKIIKFIPTSNINPISKTKISHQTKKELDRIKEIIKNNSKSTI